MQRRDFLRRTTLAVAALAVQRSSQAAEGRTIDSNPASGRDANPGTRSAPLRTLAAAAARVNAAGEPGATTVILDEGIYAVGETALFKPSRPYSKTERLTIRAAVLPDDPDWHQGRMPTLIHTMPLSAEWNGRPDPFGGRRVWHADRNEPRDRAGAAGAGHADHRASEGRRHLPAVRHRPGRPQPGRPRDPAVRVRG